MSDLITAEFGQNHDLWVEQNAEAIEAELGRNGIGAIVIPGYFDHEFCERVTAGVRAMGDHFVEAQTIDRSKKGLDPVRQNMRQLRLRLDEEQLELPPELALQIADAQEMARALSAIFPNLINWTARSVRVNDYHVREDNDDAGIDPHRDPASDVGVVIADVMDGGGVYGITDSGLITVSKQWASPVTTRTIMRATRLFDVEPGVEIRPEHYAMPYLLGERVVVYMSDDSGERSPDADPALYDTPQPTGGR